MLRTGKEHLESLRDGRIVHIGPGEPGEIGQDGCLTIVRRAHIVRPD